MWTAKELHAEHLRIIRNRWITIGVGVIAFLIGGQLNATYGPSGFWGVCGGLLFLAGLVAIFSVIARSTGIFGAQFLSMPPTTPKFLQAFTAKWPDIDISCSSCHQTAQVSQKKYQYNCEKCGIENNVWASIDGQGTPPEILEKGLPCWKCSQLNPLSKRTAWFTCPDCKSKVELEHIPTAA
jgi:predicted RNA-binding Zn-ribbon protein involved in translation (DUF1610 family)